MKKKHLAIFGKINFCAIAKAICFRIYYEIALKNKNELLYIVE